MKRMIDMNRRQPIGDVDWEFIYEMQGIAPERVGADMIRLDAALLELVPPRWQALRQALAAHLDRRGITHVALADVENRGSDFKVSATFRLKEATGSPLAFHRVIVFDQDHLEDDFIGTVISDEQGRIELSFGKSVFSDFGMETEPDIYFRVSAWRGERFEEIGRVTGKPFKTTRFAGGKTLLDYGTVTLP